MEPMTAAPEIEISIEHVRWAAETARASFERWKNQTGYYNNRLNSHFKGKLGELAVEKFLLDQNENVDSHFRFAAREKLADLWLKQNGDKKVVRLEVKTWSSHYWQNLGRCIAVNQFSDLKKKADLIIWCVTDASAVLNTPAPIMVRLAGWSKLDEIPQAPIRWTGLGPMRKVENYQLAEADLREMNDLLAALRRLS
jgi:hypothetical protein